MASIRVEEPFKGTVPRFALFSYGFRPFFLAAALQGTFSILAWMFMYSGYLPMPATMAPVLWHAHEMVFGFVLAAVAGFLLTAVPNWTGTVRVQGLPLMLLAAIWLAGRVGFLLAGIMPPWALAVVDLAFAPALGLAIGPPIARSALARNGGFILLPIAIFGINAWFHADHLGWVQTGDLAPIVAIDILLIVVSVIGGRIIPAFTQSGLRMAGQEMTLRPRPDLDRAAFAAMLLNPIVDAMGVGGWATALLFLLGAAVHAIRLASWQGWRAGALPLVWVLHLGYAWLVAGFIFRAAAAVDLLPPAVGVHAFTTGAIGTLVVGVMTRASLGHTGRQLRAGLAEVAIYLLVTVGAFLRVLSAWPGFEGSVPLYAAAILWAGGFLVYAACYGPILVGPRADGRPG